MKRPVAQLAGTGRYTPRKVLTNAELERVVETSDEWIRERSGIRERRIAEADESIAQMSKVACQQVLEDVHLTPADLDVVIVATFTPDRLLPSQACDVQAALGAKNAAAFDLAAACSGFLYALSIAEGMIASNSARNVMVVGAERLSTVTDYTDPATCILFGDGAGATLVRPTSDNDRGILSTYLASDGTLAELLCRSGGGGNHPPDGALLDDHSYFIRMSGREVFKAAVLSMVDACDQALKRAGLSGGDIDILIPHQANIRIIEATARHAGIPMGKVYVNLDRYGNTSAASIPIALDECAREGRVRAGSLILFVAFGGGLTWASAVVRW